MEGNVIASADVSDKLSTTVLLHGSINPIANDVNNDGFVDMPTNNQINFGNRWHYQGTKGWEGQLGISAIKSNKVGGQKSYVENDASATNPWGYESEGSRIELFGKNGYVFENKEFRSLGIIYSLSHQDHKGVFGSKQHNANQDAFYLNTILLIL